MLRTSILYPFHGQNAQLTNVVEAVRAVGMVQGWAEARQDGRHGDQAGIPDPGIATHR